MKVVVIGSTLWQEVYSVIEGNRFIAEVNEEYRKKYNDLDEAVCFYIEANEDDNISADVLEVQE